MIKSWAFEFMSADPELEANFDPQKSMELFNFYLDMWVRAEDQGYYGVLLSEHHFGSAYMRSPNLMLPLIAQRTKHMRVGVMGNVLPYHSPWRMVEEFGMLDNLCGGRLEIGLSAGIPAEFRRIGIQTGEARSRFDEAVEIIDTGLKKGVINHKGDYWNLQDLPITPRPVQQPAPPMWTTVISLESARKSAARGLKIATGFVSTAKAKEIVDSYNEEAIANGNPSGPDQIALRRQVIIDADEATAIECGKQFSEGFRAFLENIDDRTIKTDSRQALDSPGAHSYSLGDDEFIVGSPDQVAEQIIEQCNISGVGNFQVVFSGNGSLDQLARSWELFGSDVIPLLNKA